MRRLANLPTLALAAALGLALILGPSSEAASAPAPVLAIDQRLPAQDAKGEPEERASVAVDPERTPPANPDDPQVPDPPADETPSTAVVEEPPERLEVDAPAVVGEPTGEAAPDPPGVAATTVAGGFVSDDGDGMQMMGAAVSSMMVDPKPMTEALEGVAAFSSGFLGLGGGASSDPNAGSAGAGSASSGPFGGLLGGFLGSLP